MRLTKRVNLDKGRPSFCCPVQLEEYTTKNKHEAINKLGRLEDFEEDIGIDLEIALQATMSGVWAFRKERSKKPTRFSAYHYIIGIVGGVYLYLSTIFKGEDCDLWFLLADYGKTWALTKEELTNEHND